MKLVSLSECCDIIMGQAPVGESYNMLSDGYALIAGAGDFGAEVPEPKKFTTSPTRLSEIGDIILCIRATIGDLNWSDKIYCLGRGVASIRAKPERAHAPYIWHILLNSKAELARRGTGSTFKQISRSVIEELKIPLPPLAEQKRIAAILDKADEIRRKREKAIELTDSFLRSVFLEMFGDPNSNSKGWEVKTVGEVCACIVPGRDKPRSFRGGTPWVLSDDLVHGGYTVSSKSDLGLSESEIAEVRARKIPAGSVLMTCVGRLGVISIAGCEMVINQQLHSFQCSPLVNNIFLLALLPWKKRYMEQHASATTVPYMNKTVCNSIPVIVPPVSLQNRFAEIASKQMAMRSKLTDQLDQINTLALSLSQLLFGTSQASPQSNHFRRELEVAHAL